MHNEVTTRRNLTNLVYTRKRQGRQGIPDEWAQYQVYKLKPQVSSLYRTSLKLPGGQKYDLNGKKFLMDQTSGLLRLDFRFRSSFSNAAKYMVKATLSTSTMVHLGIKDRQQRSGL